MSGFGPPCKAQLRERPRGAGPRLPLATRAASTNVRRRSSPSSRPARRCASLPLPLTEPAPQTAGSSPAPIPVFPPRPRTPLSAIALVRTASKNSLAVWDEEMFDEPIVARRYGLHRVFVVSEPEAVRRVLLDRFDNYPRWDNTRRLFEFELNTGTLSSEGEVWRRHRRTATPVIDQRSISDDLAPMIEIAEARALRLRPAARSGAPIDLQRWLTSYSTHIWNHVVTGGDPDGMQMMAWFSRVPHKPRVLDLVPQPRWLSDLRRWSRPESVAANATLDRLIVERLDPDWAGAKDMIWRMVHAIDRATGAPLPPREIRDEAASLITGGIATVRAMTWIWYLLALHPEAEAKVHAEIDEVVGRRGRIDPRALSRMPYLRRVLDESLRLYPPIPILLRQATEADELCGRKIPAGSVTLVLPWIVHRHRKLWNDPDRFDPDRFLPENSVGRPKFAYLPFAQGPRVCIAASVAIQQLLLGVTVLARRYRFRLAPGHEVQAAGAVSLRVDNGLHMIVERRPRR